MFCIQVKCDQYWPSRGTETYGMIQVTLLDTVELAAHVIRTFTISKVRLGKVRYGWGMGVGWFTEQQLLAWLRTCGEILVKYFSRTKLF